MTSTRRSILLQSLFGSGLLGLRALATGLPVSFLMNPHKALAGTPDAGPACTSPQYLIYSTSYLGDPLNANVPGTYGVPYGTQPVHSPLPGFDPGSAPMMTLGGTQYQAAAPWTTLSPTNLCFFHHGTYTVVHPDEQTTLGLGGAVYGHEMLLSLLASQLGPCLGTIQNQPVSLGSQGASETLTYQGAPQPNLTPSVLASTLGAPTGVLGNLRTMRNDDLDAMNAWAKSQGNKAQRAFIDQYALSQTQVTEISQSLLAGLAGISSANTVADQIAAAIIMIQMNLTPVVAIHIPFGGDNHNDPDLQTEVVQTTGTSVPGTSGVASIALLQQQLAMKTLPNGTPLSSCVSFAMLNVFGRNLIPPTATMGRGHQGNHHCSVLMGPGFKGSVIGGIEPSAGDFTAMAVNASTGAPVAGYEDAGSTPPGVIGFGDTLASMGLTLGQALGVNPSFLKTNITSPGGSGAVVTAALAAT